MIPIPPFNSAQAKTLQSFLDAPDRSSDSMSYAEAAGFLFAIACAPELVQPSEWLPIIIDPDNAAKTSLESMKSITGSLMSLYNEMTRQVQTADVKLPPDINFRNEILENLDSDASISRWARGFKEGYFWLGEMWSEYIPKELVEETEYQVIVLCFFSSRDMATALHEDVKNKDVTLESLAKDMKKIFPEALSGIAHLGHSIQQVIASRDSEDHSPNVGGKKVGRNEPCLCGSGKKYKKCCGAAIHR